MIALEIDNENNFIINGLISKTLFFYIYYLLVNSVEHTQCALVHIKDVVHKVDVKICV